LDTTEHPTPGTSLAGLFGQSVRADTTPAPVARPAAAVRIPPPAVTTIEVYNGTKRSEQKIEGPGK
jgi:hypothetical protein